MSGRRTFPVPSDMFQDSDYGDQNKSSHEGYTRADSASGDQQNSSDGCPRSVHVTAEADAKHEKSQLSEEDSYMNFLTDDKKEMVKLLLASTNSDIQQSNERMLRSIMGPSTYDLYVAEKAKKKAAAKKLDTESFLAELPAELRMVADMYLRSKDLNGLENLLDSSPFPNAAHIFKAWRADITKGVESQPAVVSAARDGSSNSGKSFGSNNVSDSAVNSSSPIQKSAVTKTDAVSCSRVAHFGDSQMNFNRLSDRRQLNSDSRRFGFDTDSKRNAYSTLSIKESADAFSNRTLERYQIRNDSSNYASGDSSSYAAVAGKALDADVNRRSSSHYYDYLRNNQNRNANDGDYYQSTDNKNSRDRVSSHQHDMNFNKSSHRSWGNQDTVAPFYTSGYTGNNVLRYDPTSYENYQKPITTTKDLRERERLSRVPSPPRRPSIPSSATAVSAHPETTTNHWNRQQPTVTNDVRSMERHSPSSYQNRGSTASGRLLKTTAEQIRKLDDDFAASKINSKQRHESFEFLDTPESGCEKKDEFELISGSAHAPRSRYDKNGLADWNQQPIQSPHNDVMPMDKDHNTAMTPPPGLPARPLAPPSSKTSSADIKPTNMAGKNAFATCGAPRDKALFEDYPDMMNILVLGETGVGKSTFINGLVNYLKYDSMDAALNGGVDILIDSAFTLTDDDFKTYDIRSKATVSVEDNRRKAGSNESTVQGQSATQDPKSYIFSWGPKDREKSIRIIDTPGVGDTRGVDQDKKNFQKILSFISDFSEIHAICILIKPNTARLTLAFRFCIDELLVHLHKSASQNILFCFTNTRGTLYKPGDTLPTLREHLLKLKQNRNIDIALEKSTLFSFDNESFRFLCAMKEKFPFTETEKDNFAASWRKSVEETRRLFDRITELPVHSVQDTLSLNNTRNLILTLIRPLGEIAKMQMINRRLIQEKTEEVEHNAMAGKDLCGQLYVEQVVNRTAELDQPQTICTSASCVDHQRMENSEVVTTIYKTVCHENCKLTGVQVETIPNHLLKECFAMTNEVCKVCGCRWESHMHIKYKIEQSLERIIDPVVQESIRRRDSASETINIFLETEQQKMTELMDEQEYITKCCAEFAAFLTNNSIMPYNDSYGQYIEHLIREEEEKVAIGGGSRLLEELRMMKLHYEEQVKLLKHSISNKATSLKSVQEIDALVASLSQLKHCGTIIEDIKDIRLHHIKKNAVDNGHKIRVEGGLLSGATKTIKSLLGLSN